MGYFSRFSIEVFYLSTSSRVSGLQRYLLIDSHRVNIERQKCVIGVPLVRALLHAAVHKMAELLK